MAQKTDEDNSNPKTAAKNESRSPFSDPVFHQLSYINGQINKMTRLELYLKLRDLNLDTRGNKEVQKKRIKSYYKRQKLSKIKMDNQANQQQCDYFCIIDFEATCSQQNSPNFRHEIIEFPAVLIDVSKMKIVDKFHRYCRPVINSMLSSFCTTLTGITQAVVNNSPIFPVVLKEFEDWLATYRLGKNYTFAIVTDGPWDMGKFLIMQCKLSDIPYPSYAKRWINMRKIFSNFYGSRRLNLQQMLEHLGLRFQGRPHSGLDDSYNIARIVIHLLGDGAHLTINERLDLSKSEMKELTVSPVYLPELSKNFKLSAELLGKNINSKEDGHDKNDIDVVAVDFGKLEIEEKN